MDTPRLECTEIVSITENLLLRTEEMFPNFGLASGSAAS